MQAAQAELRKAAAGTETEKALRLGLESRLSEMQKMLEGDAGVAVVLEEKDRSGSAPRYLTVLSMGKELSLLSSSPSSPPRPHSKKAGTTGTER